MTRVPGANRWLLGIANLRGHLLPLIDVKLLLGSGRTTLRRTTRVISVNHREVPAGLVVDEVLGFRRFMDHEFTNEAPETIVRCDRFLTGLTNVARDLARFQFVRLGRKQYVSAGCCGIEGLKILWPIKTDNASTFKSVADLAALCCLSQAALVYLQATMAAIGTRSELAALSQAIPSQAAVP